MRNSRLASGLSNIALTPTPPMPGAAGKPFARVNLPGPRVKPAEPDPPSASAGALSYALGLVLAGSMIVTAFIWAWLVVSGWIVAIGISIVGWVAIERLMQSVSITPSASSPMGSHVSVADSGERRTTASGRKAVVWHLRGV